MVPAQLPKFSGCFLKEKDISTIKDEVGQCISVNHLIYIIEIRGFLIFAPSQEKYLVL